MTTGKQFLKDLWIDYHGKHQSSSYKATFQQAHSNALYHAVPIFNLLINRLVVGALRYGLIGDATKPQFDRLGRAGKEITGYRTDGNDERLLDAANMMILEYIEGRHGNKHFKARGEGEKDGTIHTDVIG